MNIPVQEYYRVEKHEAKIDRWIDYGTLPEEDVKLILKGYKKNAEMSEMFFGETEDLTGVYTRKGTQNMFSVEYEFGIERR